MFIWNDVCHFLLVISSDLGPIYHHFRDTANYGLKSFVRIAAKLLPAAYRNLVTINSLYELASALFDGAIAHLTIRIP